jgi:hypothetical protein
MKIIALLISALTLVNTAAGEWVKLFNGRDLEGLDRYVAAPPGSKQPFGLNNDPRGVFKVDNVDGRGAIHVSGELYGAVTTHAEFTNVHIRVAYKWGEKKWPPRDQPKHYRDAGMLYWCIGPNGAGSGAWMRSSENNIMEKGVGQWWSVAGTYCDVEGRNVVLDKMPDVPYRGESPGEECVLWVPGAKTYTVKPSEGITSPYDYEKPHGEWNICESILWGPVCIHMLNGKVTLVITNPRYKNEHGAEERLWHGKIQLQSEAAELFYRDFEAREIDSIPTELLKYVPIEPQDEAGFTPLFGKSPTDGWAQCGPGNFTLADGVATGQGGMGLWWYTNRTYTNFVLRGEWRQMGENSDSGVFVRFPNPQNDPWIAVKQGHEFEIGDNKPKEGPEHGTGAFYPFHGPAKAPVKAFGEWNSYELTCVRNNYALRINGELVNTWTDDKGRPLSGYIGLQNYPYKEAVQHRNVRIKELL